MTGNNDEQRPKYHGKRRNAFVGNLRYYRRQGAQNQDNRDEASEETQPRSFNVHERIRGSGIKHRLTKFSASNRLKYTINRNFDRSTKWKNEEEDELMRNTKNEGTSAELTRTVTTNQDQYRVRNQRRANLAVRRVSSKLPIKETKTYAIGEKENSFKQLLSSQSHCKLKCMDHSVFDLIVNFLQQYFMCYDSNRQDLLAAYHKNSLFSLSLNVNSQSTIQAAKFGSYFKESRNLLYVSGNERIYKMLHNGHLDIVAFLSKMPKTEHDFNSIKLDSCFFMPNMITFSVTGVFKEGESDHKPRPYRSFQRVFVCIPNQSGQMTIVNEQYTISNLSLEQSKIYKEEVDSQAKKVINPVEQIDPVLADIADPIKQKMVIEFSKFSNLNLKWAKDCLEFAQWNYDQAANAFQSHKNDIPSDAFLLK